MPKTIAMDIFVISLPNDSRRRTRLEASLAPHGLSYHWIKGIDARQWDKAQKDQYLDRFACAINMSYHPIAGSIGCYLSHLKAYQALLDSDQNAAIILEDDAEITPDFATHLDSLSQAASCFDVIFLCDRRPNRPAPLIGTSPDGLAFTFKRFANIGANGYVINRNAAAYMIANHAKFGLEIDTLLNRWWQTGLMVATTAPELVTHKDMGSSIGYDHIDAITNPLYRLAGSIVNFAMSVTKRLRFSRHLATMQARYRKL